MSGRFREWSHRMLASLRGRARDGEFDAELRAHLDEATEDYLNQGLPPGEARRRALVDVGGLAAAHEGHREARALPGLLAVAQDIRYALRTLRREPGFTAAAMLILALGIGANTAVFSVINPLLLKPLPFADAGQLVWVAGTGEGLSARTYRVSAFEAIRDRTQSFSDLSAYFAFFDYESFKLVGTQDAEAVAGVRTAPRFFETLGVEPARGRLFTAAESAPGGPPAALITDGLWKRRYGADPAIVGQSVRVNGSFANRVVTVVGVLPPTFDFAATFAPGTTVDLFIPADFDEMRDWGNVFAVVGRLKPGHTIESASAEFAALTANVDRDVPELGSLNVTLTDLKTQVSGPMRRPLIVLWAAVVLVLLIACANLSNLLIARTSTRRTELAIRLALGASRGRLLRQMLTEGLVLAAMGAAVGLPTAYALTWYVRTRTTLNLPLLSAIEVDAATLAFTAGLALATGLIVGALPALRAMRHDPQQALRDQARGSSEGPWHTRVRSGLVVTEIAVACVLLVGAGLLARSFAQLIAVDLGFRPSSAFTVRIDAGSGQPPDERVARLLQAQALVSALPGVEAAGLADALPLSRNRTWGLTVPGRVYGPGEVPTAFVYVVSPGYLSAMGIPLVDGRDFTTADTSDRPRTAVLNETLAATLFPDQDPLGRELDINADAYRVVGIVGDLRQQALDEPPAPQLYLPITQVGPAGTPNLVVRSSQPMSVQAPRVRASLGEFDPTLISSTFTPVDDLVDRVVSPRRFLLILIGGFAALALILAAVGIYAVIAYGVSQQTREIGIRMALGASHHDVRGRVMRTTGRLAVIGIAIGLAAALGATRLIAALLYETSPLDPLTFAAVGMGLLAVAFAAGYVPAWRASRIDPASALRAE